ncbi:hypothetical protein TVAG_040060 [Trichomonas vaginalis G3]|uniref:Uncharacterized protein n=1 Tax=Trichomonas vaginalis (strain ATCC PRA-98 / G3) TaxID=412133 RepID=A2EQY0_TRIV3|nr:hypothetical protein TVAGG3_0693650 [Trichomonas vaginalis G3]EAY04954.1 hypothetical protein TVAG_040060 [Trichomonas vaginalis G3]KAI5508759.1 hypothetical protein TVAGG3_0693650 [Trichomonas vaginalis G3]|eukprot:XP_001317177.1 hypothetical protein [Trichomonas vaginalis G3]
MAVGIFKKLWDRVKRGAHKVWETMKKGANWIFKNKEAISDVAESITPKAAPIREILNKGEKVYQRLQPILR